MTQLDAVWSAFNDVYQEDVTTVLQYAQLAVYTLWIGALLMLITKLLWKPMDEATTYGKLLFRRSAGEKRKQEPPHGENDSTTRTTENTPVKPVSSDIRTEAPSRILTQRFAFTSSYLLGLLWTLVLTIGALMVLLLLQTSTHVISLEPCRTLPPVYQHMETARRNPISQHSLDSMEDEAKTTVRNVAIHLNAPTADYGPQVPFFDPKISLNSEKTTYGQSICSLWHGWVKRGPSSLGKLFSESTAIDLIMFTTTNSSAIRLMVLCALLILHLTRRSAECLWVHIFSPRAIALHNLLLMWAYYFSAPLILIMSALTEATSGSLDPRYAPVTLPSLVSIGIGMELFIFASVAQFAAHRTLAAGRTHPTNGTRTTRYFVPQGGLFQIVSSPHYLAETCIYIAFVMVSGANMGSLLLLTFNILTMGTQAVKTHKWYRANFPAAQLGNRTAFIPFIL